MILCYRLHVTFRSFLASRSQGKKMLSVLFQGRIVRWEQGNRFSKILALRIWAKILTDSGHVSYTMYFLKNTWSVPIRFSHPRLDNGSGDWSKGRIQGKHENLKLSVLLLDSLSPSQSWGEESWNLGNQRTEGPASGFLGWKEGANQGQAW